VDTNNNIYIADEGNNRIRKATQITTQVYNITAAGDVNIFPNPGEGKFTVRVSKLQNSMPLVVYNILGEKVYKTMLTAAQTDINLTTQPAGIYYVSVGQGVFKVVKE